MKIKLTRKVGGRDIGDEIDVSKGAAQYLIAVGAAEQVRPNGRSVKGKSSGGQGGASPSPAAALTAG